MVVRARWKLAEPGRRFLRLRDKPRFSGQVHGRTLAGSFDMGIQSRRLLRGNAMHVITADAVGASVEEVDA